MTKEELRNEIRRSIKNPAIVAKHGKPSEVEFAIEAETSIAMYLIEQYVQQGSQEAHG